MKICLINPSSREGITGIYPSLGLGYIAAVLEKNNFNVDYIDVGAMRIDKISLRNYLLDTSPQIIGITCNSFNFSEAKIVGRIAKKVLNNALVVIGGPHVDIYPKEVMMNSEFDMGVYGEGEYTFLEFVRAVEGGKSFSKILGLIYRDGDKVIVNPPRPFIQDLDAIPFPARRLMPLDRYYSPVARKYPFTTIITGRGCPFRCFFCKPVHGNVFRLRSAGNVVDEIEFCVNNFGTKEFLFYDESFTANKEVVLKICDEILNRKLNIIWDCRTRVDLIDEEILKKMKLSGCYRIRYGVESGDQKILDIMKKGITLDRVRTAFKLTGAAGIETLAYFMIGTPGENLKTIRETINFAKTLSPDHVRFSITTAYPSTEMYEIAMGKKFVNSDVWREYTIGSIIRRPNPVFPTDEYNEEDLKKIIKEAYKEFYFRFGHILQLIKKIHSFGDAVCFLRWAKFILLERVFS